jgi:hypothetical protein
MSEVEVSLRLAIYLISSEKAAEGVSVAIDGAQVNIGETVHFDIVQFMDSLGWTCSQQIHPWQGTYKHRGHKFPILIHSRAGIGDVTTKLRSGHIFIAESKKGTIVRARSSSEYKLLREAIGQILTIESVPNKPFLAIAVPAGERFMELAARWRNAPLVRRVGIHFLTVSPNSDVQGWQ